MKVGLLDEDKVIEALRNAVPVRSRTAAWTIAGLTEDDLHEGRKSVHYLAGQLVKYDEKAIVRVVNVPDHKIELRPDANLERAASTFAYIPSESVFIHKHVWNEIRPSDFQQNVAEIIETYHNKFFAECELDSIVNLEVFATKLAAFDVVTEIHATVSPPNPLFGDFWKPLRDYIRRRRVKRMTIRETATSREAIDTKAAEIARAMTSPPRKPEPGASDQANTSPRGATLDPPEVGDAAVLMAADGYGNAQVSGAVGGQTVVVRTADNVVQLKLPKDADAPTLAQAAVKELHRLARLRGWSH